MKLALKCNKLGIRYTHTHTHSLLMLGQRGSYIVRKQRVILFSYTDVCKQTKIKLTYEWNTLQRDAVIIVRKIEFVILL